MMAGSRFSYSPENSANPIQRLGLGRRGVDRLEAFRELRPVPLRRVLERVPQEINIAGLHDGLLPDGIHRVRQPFQPIADHHQHVPHTAVLDLRADPQPVLGALPVAVLPGPQVQHVTLAADGDAQCQVDGPVGGLALPDLHVDRIDENHRVNRTSSGRLCQASPPPGPRR
jgi:hypothetical protein